MFIKTIKDLFYENNNNSNMTSTLVNIRTLSSLTSSTSSPSSTSPTLSSSSSPSSPSPSSSPKITSSSSSTKMRGSVTTTSLLDNNNKLNNSTNNSFTKPTIITTTTTTTTTTFKNNINLRQHQQKEHIYKENKRLVIKVAIGIRIFLWIYSFIASQCLNNFDSSTSLKSVPLNGPLADYYLQSQQHQREYLSDHTKESKFVNLFIKELFVKWDALYFTRIAEFGYEFEQHQAFFPLYPIITSILAKFLSFTTFSYLSIGDYIVISGFLVSNISFILSAIQLLKLGTNIFKNNRIALVSTLLYTINPANIFTMALYTESLFNLFTFTGLLYLYRSDDQEESTINNKRKSNSTNNNISKQLYSTTMAAICFGLATATRSNGLLLYGFIIYNHYTQYFIILARFGLQLINRIITTIMGIFNNSRRIIAVINTSNQQHQQEQQKPSLLVNLIIIPIFLLIQFILVATPYLAYQYYGYYRYCGASSQEDVLMIDMNTNINKNGVWPRPWCKDYKILAPNLYGFIQTNYWNQGFLRYYESHQLPNFILAAPMTILAISAIYTYLKHFINNPNQMILNISSYNQNSRINNDQNNNNSISQPEQPTTSTTTSITTTTTNNVYFTPNLLPHILHLLFLTLFATTSNPPPPGGDNSNNRKCPACSLKITGLIPCSVVTSAVKAYYKEIDSEKFECPNHPLHYLYSFCNNCQEPICPECIPERHHNHDIVNVNQQIFGEFHMKYLEQMAEFPNIKQEKLNLIEKLDQQLKKEKEHLDQSVQTKADIFDSIFKKVQNRNESLGKQLKMLDHTDINTIENHIERLQREIDQINQLINEKKQLFDQMDLSNLYDKKKFHTLYEFQKCRKLSSQSSNYQASQTVSRMQGKRHETGAFFYDQHQLELIFHALEEFGMVGDRHVIRPNFYQDINMVGACKLPKDTNNKIIITPNQKGSTGAFWLKEKIAVSKNFTCTFEFSIGTKGDGMALVIQNHGPIAIGKSGCDIGYGGIKNSISIEIDTHPNEELHDPVNDHISVHCNGTAENHSGIKTAFGWYVLPKGKRFADQAVNHCTVTYRNQELSIYLEKKKLFSFSIDLQEKLDLDVRDGLGYAWIGVTAATGRQCQEHAIHSFCVEYYK
eukprot:gene1428-1802_t